MLTSSPSSDLRQVPDHQEVYLDKQGFTSITFDILERVDSVANDDEALKYHLEDITDSEGQCQVLSSGSVKLPHLPCVQCFGRVLGVRDVHGMIGTLRRHIRSWRGNIPRQRSKLSSK